MVTEWTLHATHTIQTLGQIRDLVPILPTPYPHISSPYTCFVRTWYCGEYLDLGGTR